MDHAIKLSDDDVAKLMLLEAQAQDAHIELGALVREYDAAKAYLTEKLNNLEQQRGALMSVLAKQYLGGLKDSKWDFEPTQMSFVVQETKEEK